MNGIPTSHRSKGPTMTAATPAVQPPAAGTYRIDPSTSTIAFTTRHLFDTAAVKGSLDLRAGEIREARGTDRIAVGGSSCGVWISWPLRLCRSGRRR